MKWGDGSVYKGTWVNGIQEGIGIMIFANGVQKAGVFKENVLIELITDKQAIKMQEN